MTPYCAITGADAASLADPDRPDVYFTAGYGRAAATPESGTWQLAHWQDRILVPYIRRRYDAMTQDAISPYGYSGLHVEPGCPPHELARFWSSAVDQWRDAGLITLFLRFSPLDSGAVRAAAGLPGIELIRRADTITVPVHEGPSAIWDSMQGRSRTAIRKASKSGLTSTIQPANADDLTAGSAFRRLYGQTMRRVASAPEYLFPQGYYRRLADGLGKGLLLAEVRDPGGAVVAGALVLRHRDRAHYHLAGSAPLAARDGANNLLLWTILRWAAESGCRLVHLGGGVRAGDGLFRFKCSFGGVRTAFWTGAVVLDRSRYDALLAAHAHRLGRSTNDVQTSGYFPGYRLEGARRAG